MVAPDAGQRGDKLAAYATLGECLATVARLLAPITPFLSEEIYRNLVAEEFALRLEQETGCVLADVNCCRILEPGELQGLNRRAVAAARETGGQ